MTPQAPVDPMLAQEQAQAQNSLANAMQTQTQGDMSSLMARYGTQLSMAGAKTGPLVSSATGAILPGKV